MELNIKREPGRFFASIGGKDSYLIYKIIDSVLDITEVFVHEDQRGHGLAEELCAAAFRFAKEKNYKVAPTCPYIKEKFLPEHPERMEMIKEGEVFYRAKKK